MVRLPRVSGDVQFLYSLSVFELVGEVPTSDHDKVARQHREQCPEAQPSYLIELIAQHLHEKEQADMVKVRSTMLAENIRHD
jgi:hypothetical protein